MTPAASCLTSAKSSIMSRRYWSTIFAGSSALSSKSLMLAEMMSPNLERIPMLHPPVGLFIGNLAGTIPHRDFAVLCQACWGRRAFLAPRRLPHSVCRRRGRLIFFGNLLGLEVAKGFKRRLQNLFHALLLPALFLLCPLPPGEKDDKHATTAMLMPITVRGEVVTFMMRCAVSENAFEKKVSSLRLRS